MSYTPVVSPENISAYKSSCYEMDLNKPEEDLELLSWQKIKFKGKLIDSFPGTSDRTYLNIKVANLTYYPYVDVSYSAKVPFKIGDELIVYGKYSGFTIIDDETMVPFIRAAYIEKVLSLLM